jgi:hypothetical protein
MPFGEDDMKLASLTSSRTKSSFELWCSYYRGIIKTSNKQKGYYLQLFFLHLVSTHTDKAADAIPAGSIDL